MLFQMMYFGYIHEPYNENDLNYNSKLQNHLTMNEFTKSYKFKLRNPQGKYFLSASSQDVYNNCVTHITWPIFAYDVGMKHTYSLNFFNFVM